MHRFLSLPALTLLLALPAAAQTAAGPTPARDQLQAGAADPSCAMSAVTGEACPTVDVSVVGASTPTVKTAPATPAATHRAGADVPSPAAKKKGSFMGGAMKGIKKFFASDEAKEGTAFGAAIGMLLLSWSPVGIIGGALIGAAIGAVIGGGLIAKLFHKFF